MAWDIPATQGFRAQEMEARELRGNHLNCLKNNTQVYFIILVSIIKTIPRTPQTGLVGV